MTLHIEDHTEKHLQRSRYSFQHVTITAHTSQVNYDDDNYIPTEAAATYTCNTSTYSNKHCSKTIPEM